MKTHEWVSGIELSEQAKPREEIMLFPFGKYKHPTYGVMNFDEVSRMINLYQKEPSVIMEWVEKDVPPYKIKTKEVTLSTPDAVSATLLAKAAPAATPRAARAPESSKSCPGR